jgi:hypothetical protein
VAKQKADLRWPIHGYGIGQRIQQLAEDMLQIEAPTATPRRASCF